MISRLRLFKLYYQIKPSLKNLSEHLYYATLIKTPLKIYLSFNRNS